MRLSLIVATSPEGVIGAKGQLPWRLSADLQRFRRLTMGHAIIMGRRTFQSIGRPLPGRRSIVVSRQAEYRPEGVEVVDSLGSALELVRDDDEAFVIGGAEIYEQAFPFADRIYHTRVHAAVEGDVRFPRWDQRQWQRVEHEEFPSDPKNQYPTTFEVWDRRPAAAMGAVDFVVE